MPTSKTSPPERPAEPTNRHFWHSVTTTASSAAVWRVWSDVANWKNWDEGLSAAELDGPFEAGARGTLVTDGRKVAFQIVTAMPESSYTVLTPLPLGQLFVRRSYAPATDGGPGGKITHEVWFAGLSAPLFTWILGRKFRPMLPGIVENVSKIATAL
ncbi:SRPBCC family protein [Lewinella sp. 4G2]|uniref:SRPBCC family protein n=1 Tax=Lewinella sp. 4G2 TaxID=1803372 RepID=UPI0007B4EFE5|nr:SRPBCC family protein [Lewinella sp. 4G2]OAV44243.1 hypothetical protein A3850_006930 [Lewinella sp. 4G2]